jgi:hypothetical protein
MKSRWKILIALMVVSAIWLLVLLKLGLWRATIRPVDGVLSYTFNGWENYPVSRHLFLAQLEPNQFAQGKAYTSYTYTTLFFYFIFLAPFHFLLKLPYEIAHNVLPYFFVACLTSLLILTRKSELLMILQEKSPFRWLLAFLAIGIVITDPLPWVGSLNYNPENVFILVAGAFCYLSTWVFRDEVPKKPLLIVGIFLALWCGPLYIPAWILAGLFFNRALILERKWMLQVAGVSALAVLNFFAPAYVSQWGGLSSVSYGFYFRSGLDGSSQYMTTIFQAISSPVDPRYWPTAFYVLITLCLAVAFHYLFRKRKLPFRPLQQAFFLLIPYLTTAIMFPQMTSIHPYLTDPLLVIPATFLISYWFLQKEYWESLTGETYVGWLLVASLILMTNLLTVVQNFKR